MSNSTAPPSARAGSPQKVDPFLRIALRYSVSPNEYEALYQRVLRKSPGFVRRQAPDPKAYGAALEGRDDFNVAAIRASVRMFVASRAGLKLWESIKAAIARRRKGAQAVVKLQEATAGLSSDTRLSISLALLLLFHRVFHRFLTRLRVNLLDKNSKPFRKRNPRFAKALTSRLAPAIGASLAGFALAITPAEQLRLTIAIYASTRAAEFLWNSFEADGMFENRPWWFGSWMLMPPVFGELLYAFVFEDDCFPKPFGDFIMRFSDTYIQSRPTGYPSHLPWPDNDGIVKGLAEVAKLHYPSFESPIIHPKASLPANLLQVAPIASPAHPGITNLACAIIHPAEPSCARTYLTFFLQAFPRFAKFFAVVFGVFSLARYRAFLKDPSRELNSYGERVLRASLLLTGSIGTSWGCICLFQYLFPRGFLPKGRFFLGGFVAGIWSFLLKAKGRGIFMYCLRNAMDSTYKLGFKKGVYGRSKGFDLVVIVASLAAINVVYDRNPEAVSSGALRRALAGLRGEGWADKVKEAEREKAE